MSRFEKHKSKTILLVDDENDIRTTLGMLLAEEGYNVAQAASGREAIRLHRESPFDLVIAELIMKEKDGFETLAELRRRHPETKFIATAKSSWLPPQIFTQMARQLGAHDALPKPFDFNELISAIRNALREN